MFQRISKVAVLVALVGSFAAIPTTSALAQGNGTGHTKDQTPRLNMPVTGVVPDIGTFAGTMSISRFDVVNQSLVAIGTVSGTVLNSNGQAVRTIFASVSVPVTKGTPAGAGGCSDEVSAQQACDILNLVLGPLDLNLLGLRIQLNQVILDITGETGAGNLLGNLLCAITGLLDGGSIGTQLVGLLNQLVGILGSL